MKKGILFQLNLIKSSFQTSHLKSLNAQQWNFSYEMLAGSEFQLLP